ncbi:hypothetical protein B0T14DRAFT_494251 [Immersiella caudata]|uniref:Copper acquisition factor BIM1-like domain-containing protein n=1 Tax=Immersiella caudata TaxID=314043 RepID=A0AA40C2I6_9PEZI|nr:hypothetical protein B0T14DRAFT_494251 [Immersiella caudata]
MQRRITKTLLLLALAAPYSTHFVLEIPPSIGFQDTKEATAPCGGFEITSRNAVTDWPIAGAPLKVISTHPRSEFTIQAALLPGTPGVNASPEFIKLVPRVRQSGLGALCLTAVPGIAAWEGKDVVLQVIQVATDGQLFQCAAVKFVAGPAVPVPSLCANSSSVTATFDAGGESASGKASPSDAASSGGPATSQGAIGRAYLSLRWTLALYSVAVPVVFFWI